MLSNPQETVGLVTFTGKVLNEKLQFLCSVGYDWQGKVNQNRSHEKRKGSLEKLASFN